jgi:hypothetical protein
LLAKQRIQPGRIRIVRCPGHRHIDRLRLQQRRLSLVQHLEPRVQARLCRVVAQDLAAQRVDRPDPRCVELPVDLLPLRALHLVQPAPLQVAPHLGAHPVAHLACRLAREGDRHHAARRHPLRQQR